MHLLKASIAFIATLNMILTPAFAQVKATASPSHEDQQKLNQYKDSLESSGHKLVIDTNAGKATVLDQNSQTVMEIPFGETENLRKFSPKNLGAMMTGEMAKVKSAGVAALSHSFKSLPTESAIFFMAMGAVVAGQLITNYSQNPLGMQQHIDQQLSPVGAVSFFTFMAAQGMTSNFLSLYLTNPNYARFIPYLGMTVGAFAQSYLSQVLSDPNVLACGKVMMGASVTQADQASGIDADPCAKAYEYLVISKKIWEFAPGIVSMLASSAIVGLAETLATRALVRMVGVEIAMMIFPGGAQVKGMRLLLQKGLQLAAFATVDHWLSSKVNFVWKNFFDGKEIVDLNNRLVRDIFRQKGKAWNDDKTPLLTDLKDLHKKASAWRMMNLADVYEAHQTWSEMLRQLTGSFNASYGFYNNFIYALRAAKDGKPNRPLNMSYPFNGITAKELEPEKEDLLLTNPLFVRPRQLDTIADAVSYMAQAEQSGLYAKSGFMSSEIQVLKQIRLLMSDDNVDKKAQGVQLLREKIEFIGDDLAGSMTAQMQNKSSLTMEMQKYTPAYLDELMKISGLLGKPLPMPEPGRGYLAAYERAPTTRESLKDVNYYRAVGRFKTDHITDNFIMQMICGPDVENKESSIRQTTGFPAVFLPPQIKESNSDLRSICNGAVTETTTSIYSTEIKAGNGNYKGVLDYLKSHTRPSVLGSADGSAFPDWWKKNTEPQMQDAFEKFSALYDAIIVRMIRSIYQQTNSVVNVGPLANGAITSLLQEARVYEVVLGEILKDVYKSKNKSALPKDLFVSTMEPAVQFIAVETLVPDIPLIAMLGRGPTLEFARLTQPFLKNPDVNPTYSTPTGYGLKAQAEIENQFTAMNNLLKRIKIVSVPVLGYEVKREVIQSDLENSDLEDQLKKIQAALAQFATLLGAGDNKQGALVDLTPDQRELAVTCLENIQAVATEMMMYGTISNAVSWDKIRNLKSVNMEQQKFNNKVQQQLNALRGMTLSGK